MLTQDSNDVLLNPVASTIIGLLEILGVSFSRFAIRAHLSSHASYPHLTLADVMDTLEFLGIECLAFETAPDLIDRVPLPAVIPLCDRALQDNVLFVLATSADPETVGIVHPLLGDIKLSRSRFESEWSGIGLFAQASPGQIISPPSTLALEAEAAQAYRASMRLVENVVSMEDCAAIIAYCEDMKLFDKSEILIDSQSAVDRVALDQSRTSSSALLQCDGRGFIAKLRKVVAHILGVPDSDLESLQCARYLPDQEFRPHFDAGPNAPRTATAIVYLNDDFEGGSTLFPELKYEVRPKRGSCLVFRNLDDQGRRLPQSLHAGLPVRTGIKYVCNVWVRADASS
ncbi:hypothetical protein BRX37_03435 [Sphingomonas sp. S-NIH.Pt3_0716]|nr:hypothetical protein BRX37_03435 [Sphingomonas sp. S-NIH.Pt3_0716]